MEEESVEQVSVEQVCKEYMVKTLGTDKYVINLTPDNTILDLKTSLESKTNESISNMKIIYRGEVLANNLELKNLSENFDETSFFVLLISKRTPVVEVKEEDEVIEENTLPKYAEILGRMSKQLIISLNEPSVLIELLSRDPELASLLNESEELTDLVSDPEFLVNSISMFLSNLSTDEDEDEDEDEEEIKEDFLENVDIDVNVDILTSATESEQSYMDTCNLTDENKQDIEVIKEMLGLSTQEICHSYIACGMDKELTINFLLNNMA